LVGLLESGLWPTTLVTLFTVVSLAKLLYPFVPRFPHLQERMIPS
jgi:hypothetical protein